MVHDTWSSRSLIVGSLLHLTHEVLNLFYPFMPLNNSLPLMGKVGKNMLLHANYGQIQPRLMSG